jgi:phosphate/sulfate permease
MDFTSLFLVGFCLLAVFAFEFINGFHDTANAVATVIYSKSLKPFQAVLLSGILNFLGVLLGGIGVAMAILDLLPVNSIMENGGTTGLYIVLATLFSAIAWNLGTWYYGIPCSSSHTLIGSMLGAGIGFALSTNGDVSSLPWGKAKDIGLSLFISPLLGFAATLLLLVILKRFLKSDHVVFDRPRGKKRPPLWIRSVLIGTCSAVSFSHGSNDGQKGVGLAMLILFCLIPGKYALDGRLPLNDLNNEMQILSTNIKGLDKNNLPSDLKRDLMTISVSADSAVTYLTSVNNVASDPGKLEVRHYISVIKKRWKIIDEHFPLLSSSPEFSKISPSIKKIRSYSEFAPTWIIVMISLALGIGTMIGWKRIVITIGRKIGKDHLTYAQGGSAEVVTAITIFLATHFKLPVSTTHILSSGIAGSMVAGKGLNNLNKSTIKNIALAWVLTLPVTILMSMGFYFVLLLFK